MGLNQEQLDIINNINANISSLGKKKENLIALCNSEIAILQNQIETKRQELNASLDIINSEISDLKNQIPFE